MRVLFTGRACLSQVKVALLTLLLLGGSQVMASVPGDENWVSMVSGLAGVNGQVNSIAIQGGDIYLAGSFTVAGNVFANNIVKWNGTTWTALGSGLSANVTALAIDTNGNLYAGGQFTQAGGLYVNHLAMWNGSSWTAVGSGVSGMVLAMTIDSNNVLYVTDGMSSIYKWDGTSLSLLTNSIVDGGIYTMAVDSSNNLYIAGNIQSINGTTVNNLARWDGINWSPVDSGISWTPGSTIYALVLDKNGNIFVGGSFSITAPESINNIAEWNGVAWLSLGSWLQVNTLGLDSSGSLYASGFDGNGYGNLEKWNGSIWTVIADVTPNTIMADNNGSLYIGHSYASVGGIGAHGVAKWDGTAWTALGSYINGGVSKVMVSRDGSIYLCGHFQTIEGFAANGIARWSGGVWSPLGNGVGTGCYALVEDDIGNIYAGGPGGVQLWNGTSWVFMPGSTMGVVKSLIIDKLGNFYEGGSDGIKKWNGSIWIPVDTWRYGWVISMIVDSDGLIYASSFYFDPVTHQQIDQVYKWDGIAWTALGGNFNNYVYSIAVDSKNTLYAGGAFTKNGSIAINYAAKWDGKNWNNFGNGIGYLVSLAVDTHDNIYAGGGIAKWNGAVWLPLGSGVDNIIQDIAVSDTAVYSGGEFFTAGGKLSPFIAKWKLDTDTDGDGVIDSMDCFPADNSQSICLPGTYPTGSGYSFAPAGSYASNGIATQCPAGTYNPNSGSSDLSACLSVPPGTYSFVGTSNYANNASAPAGTYAGADGVLYQCPAGTANPNTGSTDVSACVIDPPGTYSLAGSSLLTNCPAGTYNPASGGVDAFACLTAPAGTYVSIISATTTTNCPAGTYNPNTRSTSSSACVQTPAGSYSGAGAAAPTQTPAGSYSLAGAAAPTACAAGSWSAAGASSCYADSDGDHIANSIDNCPMVANANQADSNGNGIGDVCDPDSSALGSIKGDNAGTAVVLYDMDGDGYADILVGSPGTDRGKLKDVGSIRIISGATGQVINTLYGTSANQHFGAAFAVVADQDHDNIPDLVVGNPAAAVDVGGAAISNNVGNVSLYSGATGAFISSIANGTTAGEQFGASVATGDVNNDSAVDLIVGSPMAANGSVKAAGKVSVFNGLSNSVLYIRTGLQAGEHFGAAMAFNSHDKQLLIGSPGYDDTYVSAGKTIRHSDAGLVQIFDATDLTGTSANLFSKTGTNKGDHFGAALASFNQDITGDGFDDWAVGIPGFDISTVVGTKAVIHKDIGRVEFFSGTNTTPLAQHIDGAAAGDNLGAALVTGDINGDGKNDLATGSPKYDVSTSVSGKAVILKDAGRVEVVNSNQLF